jgi:ADP-ribosylglycohydrolase
MDLFDRYQGALAGLATCDALGTTLEFKQPGTFEPIGDLVGRRPFRPNPGEWTDDTSMALGKKIVLHNSIYGKRSLHSLRHPVV